MKYEIELFDMQKGAASATIADYGITLNGAATSFLAGWRFARVGLDKKRKLIVLVPHNDEASASGSVDLRSRLANAQYLRISSKDFIRLVSLNCNMSFQPSVRCLAEWDDDEKVLVINLEKIIDVGRSDETREPGG